MLVATAQDVLMVAPTSPFRSVKDLVDHAKARPGQLNYAALGPGTSAHLATVLFSHVPASSFSTCLTRPECRRR